jgi:hypothetical protein
VVSQVAPGSKILPNLGFRSHDYSRKQVASPVLLKLVYSRLNRLSDDFRRSPPNFRLNRLAVETHLRRNFFGLRAPLDAPSRGTCAVPIQPFDISRVAPEIGSPRPKHRVVDVEAHRNVLLKRPIKRLRDKSSNICVRIVERQQTEDDRQAMMPVTNASDPTDDIVYKCVDLVLWG